MTLHAAREPNEGLSRRSASPLATFLAHHDVRTLDPEEMLALPPATGRGPASIII